MGKYVTLTEIAKKLGVSHSTVSRALHKNPRISKETQQRVQQLADELGYQVNDTAHLLSKGKSHLIGVIIPDIAIYFYAKVVEAIQQSLKDTPYSIVLFNTAESVEEEIQVINKCLNFRTDGILAAISMQTKTFVHFEKLLKHEVPLVFFDRVANFLPVPKVITNDYQASYNATKYLIDSGCKCIAHITASINLNNSNNRMYGYLDALRDNNQKIKEELIHYYALEQQSIEIFLRNTIAKYPQVDGLFVFNDYVANQAVNILQKLGKHIPADISVMGFSDEPVATYMTPQLSTVEQVAPKMGRLAAQKLISIINRNEPQRSEKIIINQQLVLRETTRGM